MIQLKNSLLELSIIEDCGFTVSTILYKKIPVLYFPFSIEEYKNNQELAGIPFLYPWANRLSRNHFFLEQKEIYLNSDFIYRDPDSLPIHGLLLKTKEWKIQTIKENQVRARFDFDGHWLKIFPFKHRIFYSIFLKENTINFTITLKDFEGFLPVSFGFHPYFLVPDKKLARFTLPASYWIETDEKMIPTGNQIPVEKFFEKEKIPFHIDKKNYIIPFTKGYDDGFTGLIAENKKNIIKLSRDNFHIVVGMELSYSVVQIYSPYQSPFVCIEPMITYTNAFISSQYLRIKEEKEFTFWIQIID